MEVDFKYKELFNFGLRKSWLGFWLHTKRGERVYSQEFCNFVEEGKSDRCSFEAKIFYKLRELLIMLDRQLETGYLTELLGDYYRWDIKQRKLTKNMWITAERLN